jgi:flagellar biosynthesis protein FlhF
MKIKKIIAKDLKEGKQKVNLELGEDAVILSSRTIVNPSTNEQLVEIVAAIDEALVHKKNPLEKITLTEKQHEKENVEEKYLEVAGQIFNEIGLLSDKMSKFYENIQFNYLETYPDEFKQFHQYLIESEISNESAISIISKIYKTYPGADINALKIEFNKHLGEVINFGKTIKKEKKQQIIVFTGPSGMGKTLTLVKLAVLSKLILNCKVSILSSDSYKVSGIEQMQTYSSIAGVPFFPLYEISDLKTILAKEYDDDIIFIDTIGKSPNDVENMQFTKDIIQYSNATLVYLVLAANLSQKNYEDLIEQYKQLNIDALIISKIDESKTIGQLYEVLAKSKFTLAYFTNGQKVPENIEPGSSEYFSDMFFKNLENNNIR